MKFYLQIMASTYLPTPFRIFSGYWHHISYILHISVHWILFSVFLLSIFLMYVSDVCAVFIWESKHQDTILLNKSWGKMQKSKLMIYRPWPRISPQSVLEISVIFGLLQRPFASACDNSNTPLEAICMWHLPLPLWFLSWPQQKGANQALKKKYTEVVSTKLSGCHTTICFPLSPRSLQRTSLDFFFLITLLSCSILILQIC